MRGSAFRALAMEASHGPSREDPAMPTDTPPDLRESRRPRRAPREGCPTGLSRRLALAASLLAVAVAACRPASAGVPPLSSAAGAAIHAIDTAFVQGWLRDDTSAVLAPFSPDARRQPPGARAVVGREATDLVLLAPDTAGRWRSVEQLWVPLPD
ncbi:MAG: hypothetical protein HY275_05845 [Gemmatimonadetes bacterium]|nr:hypothetical protein [Gemmatimonadota bacterium]